MPLSLGEALEQARRKGLIVEKGVNHAALSPDAVSVEDKKPLLLPSVFVPPGTWIVGVQTISAGNLAKWRGLSNHTKKCRAAVSKLFGKHLRSLAEFAEHYHNGGSVRITFTRLAPKRLDAGNVSMSVKAVEDAVALLMGADDGDMRWVATYEQEQSERYGVRIVMEVV